MARIIGCPFNVRLAEHFRIHRWVSEKKIPALQALVAPSFKSGGQHHGSIPCGPAAFPEVPRRNLDWMPFTPSS